MFKLKPKLLTLIIIVLFSLNSLAANSLKEIILKHKPNPDCIFDIIPLNSPVKESAAKFLLLNSKNLEIDEVSYQLKNAGKIFDKPSDFKKINLEKTELGLEFKIEISKLPPGFYQLFVKVKDHTQKEYFFKTKYKDHAMFTIDQTQEVPEPDSKKNDATIGGVDSDGDGIRDDIQRWINEEFNNQPKVKAAMRQAAITRQVDLLSVDDTKNSIAIGKTYLNDRSCLKFIAGLENRIHLSNKLDSKLLNTKERRYADIKANANFSGQGWIAPRTQEEEKSLCNFDPDNL